MLILGIETATTQVGCAIGSHEGVRAAIHSARAKRHCENLTPAIEFLCVQAEISLDDIGLVAVDVGVERALQAADRQRAVPHDFPRPLHAFGFELRDGDDRVDQPHIKRLLRVVLTAQIPNLPRLFLTDDPRKIT